MSGFDRFAADRHHLFVGLVGSSKTRDMTDLEIADYVGADLHRRDDIKPSQLAIAAAMLANVKHGSNQHEYKNATNPCKKVVDVSRETSTTREGAAAKFGVSVASIARACAVIEKAPELVEFVRDDKLDVNVAEKLENVKAVITSQRCGQQQGSPTEANER